MAARAFFVALAMAWTTRFAVVDFVTGAAFVNRLRTPCVRVARALATACRVPVMAQLGALVFTPGEYDGLCDQALQAHAPPDALSAACGYISGFLMAATIFGTLR